MGFSREAGPEFVASASPRGVSASPVGNDVDITISVDELDEGRIAAVPRLIAASCVHDNPIAGFGHDETDLAVADDPRYRRPFTEVDVHEAYWILVFGKALVEKLGRDRVMSAPAHHVEALPQGGAMIVTMPSPLVLDAATRRAQAAVLQPTDCVRRSSARSRDARSHVAPRAMVDRRRPRSSSTRPPRRPARRCPMRSAGGSSNRSASRSTACACTPAALPRTRPRRCLRRRSKEVTERR